MFANLEFDSKWMSFFTALLAGIIIFFTVFSMFIFLKEETQKLQVFLDSLLFGFIPFFYIFFLLSRRKIYMGMAIGVYEHWDPITRYFLVKNALKIIYFLLIRIFFGVFKEYLFLYQIIIVILILVFLYKFIFIYFILDKYGLHKSDLRHKLTVQLIYEQLEEKNLAKAKKTDLENRLKKYKSKIEGKIFSKEDL